MTQVFLGGFGCSLRDGRAVLPASVGGVEGDVVCVCGTLRGLVTLCRSQA